MSVAHSDSRNDASIRMRDDAFSSMHNDAFSRVHNDVFGRVHNDVSSSWHNDASSHMRKEWLCLLHEELDEMNRRQYNRDLREYNAMLLKGKVNPGDPLYPHGSFVEYFNPEDCQSVMENANTVRRCLDNVRHLYRRLPDMECLPAAILNCSDLRAYLDKWRDQ
jgi:hypothetical protein